MGGCCGGGSSKVAHPDVDEEGQPMIQPPHYAMEPPKKKRRKWCCCFTGKSLFCLCCCNIILMCIPIGFIAIYVTAMRWESELLKTSQGGMDRRHTDEGEVQFFQQANNNGPYVMIIHGQMSGSDFCQEPLVRDHWLDAGYSILCPSRLGYLGSSDPVSGEKKWDQQAVKYNALIERIGRDSGKIGPVVVVAYGMGGPSAFAFAQKYPEKTVALISLSAVATFDSAVGSDEDKLEAVTALSSPATYYWANLNWYLSDRDAPFCEGLFCSQKQVDAGFFASVVRNPLVSYAAFEMNKEPKVFLQTAMSLLSNFTEEKQKAEIDRILANETLKKAAEHLVLTGHLPYSARWSGNVVDIIQRKELELEEETLEKIKTPTMVIHDANSGGFGVGLESAEFLKKHLPSSSLKEFIIAESAWQYIFLAPEWPELAAKQVKFAKESNETFFHDKVSVTPGAAGATTGDAGSHIKLL